MAEQDGVKRQERAVRHTVGSIMSGRADGPRVVERLVEQGFQPEEIQQILQESARRMGAAGKAADQQFFNSLIKLGAAILVIVIGALVVAGHPQHARGVGVLSMGLLSGIGAIVYGLIGRALRR